MEMNLQRTLELARLEVITDRTYFYDIIKELFDTPFSVLESGSPTFFSFVRTHAFKDKDESFFDTLTFRGIAALPNEFANNESKLSRRFLQCIACGLLELSNYAPVKAFLMLSAQRLSEADDIELLDRLGTLASDYLYLDLTPELTIGELLKEARTVMASPWDVSTGIFFYRDSVQGAISIIDTVLDSAMLLEKKHRINI